RGRNPAVAAPKAAAKITRSGDTTVDRSGHAPQPGGRVTDRSGDSVRRPAGTARYGDVGPVLVVTTGPGQFVFGGSSPMSQNGPYPGPPWPGGRSDDEPYAEPADPW